MMPARAVPGVFCLEGNWSNSLKDRSSVRSLLTTLEDLNHVRFVHRDVATLPEFEHYLSKWTQQSYRSYRLLHLAFHGDKGGIMLDRKVVPLSDVADMLGPKCADRIIYFGSCGTMKVPTKELDAFRKATKAKAVCGYRRDVDWLESAAFELLLIHALTQDHRRIDARFNELRRTYPDFVRRLKFDSSPAFGRAA